MRIKTLNGDKPHPDYGGWKRFLTRHCEVRDQHDGVTYYGVTNCNYIVFPGGTLVRNFGYNGRAMMGKVRAQGATAVLDEIREMHRKTKEMVGV